jgi:hypothetical protein
MEAERLLFEQWKINLKWYWEFEERVWSTKRVAAWICNGTSNTINNCTHSWKIWGRWYSAWCAQANIWGSLHSNESRLFCYGVGTVYMITTKVRKTMRTWDRNYGNESFHFQQDGAPPHYHRDIRSYFDGTVPGKWIGRRGSVDCAPRSSDLTPLDFSLWGSLEDVVYGTKPQTLETLREEIETSCAAFPVDSWLRLLVHQSAEIRSVYKLMVGTLNTCSSSTCVAAIPFYVYQSWIANELFKQIFCTLKCVHIFWTNLCMFI